MFKAHRYMPAYLLVAGLLLTTPACAAGGYYAHQRDSSRAFEGRAFDNGYREGARYGEIDARNGRRFSYNRHLDDRLADGGYRRGRERGFYRRAFRQGFERGYTEAFSRAAGQRRYDRR